MEDFKKLLNKQPNTVLGKGAIVKILLIVLYKITQYIYIVFLKLIKSQVCSLIFSIGNIFLADILSYFS